MNSIVVLFDFECKVTTFELYIPNNFGNRENNTIFAIDLNNLF